jgi:hypothetical protein
MPRVYSDEHIKKPGKQAYTLAVKVERNKGTYTASATPDVGVENAVILAQGLTGNHILRSLKITNGSDSAGVYNACLVRAGTTDVVTDSVSSPILLTKEVDAAARDGSELIGTAAATADDTKNINEIIGDIELGNGFDLALVPTTAASASGTFTAILELGLDL